MMSVLNLRKEQLNESRAILDEIIIDISHKDINTFCEIVLKDNKGKRIKQAHIHELIHNHIDWCKKNKYFAGIVAPWGHGKTEQAVIARTLWELGRNPEARITIVCNTDGNAQQRVASIRRYIESDSDYKLVFPNIRPMKRGNEKSFEKWSNHELLVQRKTLSKDSSVEAWGIFSSAMGKRCDLLIIDDPADFKNTVLEPATRSKVYETIQAGWISRLEQDGFCIYIATIWHEEDCTMALMKNEKFCFLWMAISEDFKNINVKLYGKDTKTHPVWQL